MRSGKTKSAIDLACHLWDNLEIDGVLVVAPNNVHLNWGKRELPIHHWDSVGRAQFVWQSDRSTDVNYSMGFEAFCAEHRKLTWYMVNTEALALKKPREWLRRYINSRQKLLVIVDEVHEFAWSTSKRWRGLKAIVDSRRCEYTRILSANPLDNCPLHAYAEFELLGSGTLGYEDYASFEAVYAEKGDIYVPGGFTKLGIKRSPRKQEAVVGYKNLDDLRARIAKVSGLVLRSELEDMPELLRGRVDFELDRRQKDLHNALVRETLARLDGGEIIPPAEGGVLAIRLQQIASGFVVGEDGQVLDVVPDDENPRILALYGELRLAPGKSIVWCRFREDVVRVTNYLKRRGVEAVHYYGGTTPKERERHVRSFTRTDGGAAVLVGQFQAGGQGLDFSVAEDLFWYSQTANLLKRRQADERATKIGGKRIGVTDLVAAGSTDEKMLADLAARRETADFLTGRGLREYLNYIK